MSAPVERLLARLEGVRRTGPGRWIARCPAHDDARPSLSIREGDDGRVLLYDFAECSAADVVEALGMRLSDLFEDAGDYTTAASRRAPRIPAADALEMIDEETLVVEIIADRLAKGEPLEQHVSDLELAANRIAAVRRAWRVAA